MVSVFLVGALVLSFIFMGGLKTFGSLGTWKIAVLYAALALCLGASLKTFFSPGSGAAPLPFHPFFNPFGQGVGQGLGASLSVITGVLCTQIYIQAIFSASDPSTARRGALLSAALMPPMGLMGIVVGLASGGGRPEPATALPISSPPVSAPLSGTPMGAILVTLIGTGGPDAGRRHQPRLRPAPVA